MGGNTHSFGRDRVVVLGTAECAVEADCFADEVGIDFPSVAAAVDRIRRSFLADEDSAALSTTIHLSAREAREGATVPLLVPISCACGACGGRGESWTEPCTRCQGSGAELRRHQLQVAVPAGVLDGTRLEFTLAPRHDRPTRIELRVLVG
ncbi:MAG: hypothetical protein A3I61_05775 [Acidobacteria bacterium RIFCSPLOWO2_02_FULL_68_18]|nr:MAG: hypothetical protein A3I61_05775 [Acidobacteria bacterium RIFCSPLOWO2_02_FULL_68_18]OFW48911.1 MAG: hypothetical protein A3G77_01755 [Acidobacteria bacterium RIFCSPLOWO2_12_FULL_68_19]